ncbi:MAG: ABC transporter permease [Planctomycetota bacterium]|nr:ABC transporter permease [Planctomycetota bacterium]
MNIFQIAWRSIQQRGIASTLTMLSMALGVMLVVLVLSIYGIVSESFRANSTLGYHLIVGARGGSLQLTLNSVYYLSQPVENIPYEYYLAFKTAEDRQAELEHSIAYQTQLARQETVALVSASQLGIGGGVTQLADEVLQEFAAKQVQENLGMDQDGMFSNFTGMAIPLCLGDYFGQYRVVGTTPDLFDKLVYDFDRELTYKFSQGRNFKTFTQENGYFECVVGSIVAQQKGVKLGDQINPSHGDPNGHGHAQGFTVVGILESSGTPNDRAVFVNIEGFFLMEDHAKPVDEGMAEDSGDDEEEWEEFLKSEPRPKMMAREPWTCVSSPATVNLEEESDAEGDSEKKSAADVSWESFEPLPIEQREVTSVLILADDALTGGDMAAMHIVNMVNEGVLEGSLEWSKYRPTLAQKSAQGVQPISEIERLFQAFVGPVQYMLLTLTIMICVVSGISILVSIYNSMNERRHELAVMRALGASRDRIMRIVLTESIMISLMGGLIGWVGAHGVVELISPYVEAQTGVSVGFMSFVPAEFWVLPGVMGLAVVVGFYPAISAYFTDVSRSLGK